jgi:hypothetical protein
MILVNLLHCISYILSMGTLDIEGVYACRIHTHL